MKEAVLRWYVFEELCYPVACLHRCSVTVFLFMCYCVACLYSCSVTVLQFYSDSVTVIQCYSVSNLPCFCISDSVLSCSCVKVFLCFMFQVGLKRYMMLYASSTSIFMSYLSTP